MNVRPAIRLWKWQGQKDSNPRPSVLETDALPTELYPYGPSTDRVLGHLCLVKQGLMDDLPPSKQHTPGAFGAPGVYEPVGGSLVKEVAPAPKTVPTCLGQVVSTLTVRGQVETI